MSLEAQSNHKDQPKGEVGSPEMKPLEVMQKPLTREEVLERLTPYGREILKGIDFKIFRISVGGTSVIDLRNELKNKDVEFSSTAKNFFNKIVYKDGKDLPDDIGKPIFGIGEKKFINIISFIPEGVFPERDEKTKSYGVAGSEKNFPSALRESVIRAWKNVYSNYSSDNRSFWRTPTPSEVDGVVESYYNNIFSNTAQQLGLDPCPQDVAAHLLLDFPKEELQSLLGEKGSAQIFMEPVYARYTRHDWVNAIEGKEGIETGNAKVFVISENKIDTEREGMHPSDVPHVFLIK